MSLHEYELELLNSNHKKSENVFQRIADSYEDELLEFNDFPQEYFEFALMLLSDERYYSKPGVWNFLLVLGTESHKLTPEHYKKLSKSIIDNYKSYRNEDLCLSVCDFIARNYPQSDAKLIFGKLKAIEEQKPETERGFVEDGLRILAAEIRRSESTPSH